MKAIHRELFSSIFPFYTTSFHDLMELVTKSNYLYILQGKNVTYLDYIWDGTGHHVHTQFMEE